MLLSMDDNIQIDSQSCIPNIYLFENMYTNPTQDNIQKNFYDQLRSGDFLDVKNSQGEWKLAKVIDKESKMLSIIFDGYPPENDQVYLTSMRVQPLRSNTTCYTGPPKNTYTTITSIAQLKKQLGLIDTILTSNDNMSAYKITQYLRGELFSSINSLLMSQLKFSSQEIQEISTFFLRLIERISKICLFIKNYCNDYFEANLNKFIYLVNYRLALIYSLDQLLYVINLLISIGADTPKLIKIYKAEMMQENLIEHVKQYIPLFIQLFNMNDGAGRWLPTRVRLQLAKILIKYKKDQEVISTNYDDKDYLQFYAIWPPILLLSPGKQVENKLVKYITTLIVKPQAPFDAKLKSLQTLKKVLQKQLKLSLSTGQICQFIQKKNIIESLLQSFNPQIFKRFIPILSTIASNSKKYILQAHIDIIFKLLWNRHESQRSTIYEIIVLISEFASPEILDHIYTNILEKIDAFINDNNGIKFITQFTINAIENLNTSKNKGFLGMFTGKKRNSSKYGYYGLNLFHKEIEDAHGKVQPKNVISVITKIGNIFQKQQFHHQRFSYMVICLQSIEKHQNYGQSIKILQQIISSYPSSNFIGETQSSIVNKLDDKYHILDIMISPLKSSKNDSQEKSVRKVSMNQSIKFFYEFLEKYNKFLKFGIGIDHIMYLWSFPHIFNYLRKARELSEDTEIPNWKKKYYKTVSKELIRGIFTKLLCNKANTGQQYIICNQNVFETMDELFISYNLAVQTIELTQKNTIRYINIDNMVGLQYYFRFLTKLLKINSLQGQNSSDSKPHTIDRKAALQRQVLVRIFQLHLRPYNHSLIVNKCKNWMICLIKIIKLISGFKEKSQLCLFAIQKFMELIKGRLTKDIQVTGKLEILVSYESKEKLIIIHKNNTILKLRELIMQSFNLKTNFTMYNTSMKREITFFEEEDFTVNAMPCSIKGPSIYIRKALQGSIYPQYEARQAFMEQIKNNQYIYTAIFNTIDNCNELTVRKRAWQLLQLLPVHQKIINQIKDSKSFTKQKWEEFLMPIKLQEIQYRINVIYDIICKNNEWLNCFLKSKGDKVIEQLFLVMLNSNDTMREKILLKLANIMLKIIQNRKNSQVIQNSDNGSKIANKILNIIEQYSRDQQGSQNMLGIQCINLMIKWVLLSCSKYNVPDTRELIQFLTTAPQDNPESTRLLLLSDRILFEQKNLDTTFYTEQILEKITFQMIVNNKQQQGDSEAQQKKISIFIEHLRKYLDVEVLKQKKSVDNYFIYIVDFVHREVVSECESKVFTQEFINKFIGFVNQAIEIQPETQIAEQILNGCFKLLNLFMNYQNIYERYDQDHIFKALLSHMFNLEKKIKNKTKKLMYDIVKKLCYKQSKLLEMFIARIQPKLQAGDWRKNTFMSWNLEQQKKQKRYFCGLENLGATCYINCLFQQLFMIKRFRDRFIKVDSIAYRDTLETNEIYQLQKLLTYMKYGNKKSYSTKQFCQSFITYEGVPIDTMVQNDADEFFNAMMDKIQTFLKMTNQHTILEDTFQGKLSNQLNCQGCPHNSEKIENFLSIGLNIKQKKSLQQALDCYVNGQILDGDNAYYCEICQKKVRTMKRLCIKELPNVLVIVLKRFTYDFDEMKKIKINDELRYSEEIDMKPYTSQYLLDEQENIKNQEYYHYKLRGVVVHAGTSDAGHYYSFIKEHRQDSSQQGQWYEFNDDLVEESDYKKIEEEGFGGEEKSSQIKLQKYKNAYILFYERKVIEEDDLVQVPTKCSKDTQEISHSSEIPETNDPSEISKISETNDPTDISETNGPKNKQLSQQNQQTQNQGSKGSPNQLQKDISIFAQELSQKVLHENANAEFLGILLDTLFVRLSENVTMIGYPHCSEFILLYFHTVLLRDKNKDEYIGNIYRIMMVLMTPDFKQENDQVNNSTKGPKLCLWYLNQINLAYVTEFLLEAPKLIRYIISGLIIHAIKQLVAQGIQLPENLINSLTFVLNKKKKGLNPLGKIFTYLSSLDGLNYRQKLIEIEYPQRVINILLPKKFQINSVLEYQEKPSFFYEGTAIRNILHGKQKELDPNISTMVESLKYYPDIIDKQQAIEVLESQKFNVYRPGNRAMAQIIAHWNINALLDTNSSSLSEQINLYQEGVCENTGTIIQIYESRVRQQKHKKQDIEKYLFIIRYHYKNLAKVLSMIGEAQTNNYNVITAMIDKLIIQSLKRSIKVCENSYLGLELIITEINKIASHDHYFKRKIQESMTLELSKQKKQKDWDMYGIMDGKQKSKDGLNARKSLHYWLKQSSHPHYMGRNEEWTSRVAGLSFSEKQTIIRKNIRNQELRTQWMLEVIDKNQPDQKAQNDQKKIETKYEKRCQEIYSDLEEVQPNKLVYIGTKSYRVLERLGLLVKVENEDHSLLNKATNRWAVLQRNQLDFLADF